MNTSLAEELTLAEELERLNAEIERSRHTYEGLEGELRAVEAELDAFSAERQRFDVLRAACDALDKLGELKADALFWEGIAEPRHVSGHLEQVRSRVVRFDGEISGILEKQASLRGQIDRCLEELNILDEEVRDAYAREERRQEEFVVEREISAVPVPEVTIEAESETRFRKALRVALLVYVVLGILIPLWKLPLVERPAVVAVPERLVSMLRNQPPKPEPHVKEEKKPEKDQEKTPKEERTKPTTEEAQVARKKAEATGMLAFKESLKDLMDETPAAQLGAEARLSNQPAVAAGQARASRSLVAMEATGNGSGGISNSGVSRNIGHGNGNRIGGVGFTRVESSVAGLAEESRPLSSGPGPARTDEEIQIVFDKYKATLYRMYNAELRKNPTLRGRMILRMTIEPGGEVSLCAVQSSDLASPELATQIVERVKKFNFGPKEKVSRITILYPIDFLPGG